MRNFVQLSNWRTGRCWCRPPFHAAVRKIRGLLRDWASRTKENFYDVIERGAEGWESVSERGREFVEQGKESLSEAGRQAKGFAEEGKSQGSMSQG